MCEVAMVTCVVAMVTCVVAMVTCVVAMVTCVVAMVTCVVAMVTVEAQKLEKVSLQAVQELIHRVEEVLGLLKVLVDHQFHTLAATLTKVGTLHSWISYVLNICTLTELN